MALSLASEWAARICWKARASPPGMVPASMPWAWAISSCTVASRRLVWACFRALIGLHGRESTATHGDDCGDDQHGAQDAGASAQRGGMRLGGCLFFLGGPLAVLGGAQFGVAEFGLLALLLGLELRLTLRGGLLKGLPFPLRTGRQRRLLLFCAPPVAVFAYDAGEHIVRQFDPLRAVVFLEP